MRTTPAQTIEGTRWDVGLAVRFLLSNHARFITGQTLVVDGGAALVGPARATHIRDGSSTEIKCE